MEKVKIILLSIFFYGFSAFLMTLGVMDYYKDQGIWVAIQSGVIVQAEWIGIVPRPHDGPIAITYDLGYEYIDENGVRYRGQVVFGLKTPEEAEAYIGRKVDIYIDGNGHSIPVHKADDFDINTSWILMGIGIGVAVGYTVGLIIWCVWQHKHKDDPEEVDSSII